MSEQGVLANLTSATGWENCPADVLMLIFSQLDGRSLVSCMAVNEWWRDVVDLTGQHYGLWPNIAQTSMLNKGLTFRNKSSPAVGWRDLYFNSHLWWHVADAKVTWKHFQHVKDIQSLHVYKDILIVGYNEQLRMMYYKMNDVFESLDAASKAMHTEEPIARAVREEVACDSEHIQNEVVEGLDRMKVKLLKEGPFMKYTIFNDKCFYMLDERNVMRRYVWDKGQDKWLDEVLGRYYGCARSIKDIYVYDDDVYILLKTGYVMKAHRSGRNFENASVFDFPPHSLTFFMRLFRSNLLRSIETVFILEMPEYCTPPNIMFHKLSVVVAVPGDKEFKVNLQNGADHVVIECPDLTCALEHGEMLFLGYKDGRVDMCRPKKFLENDAKPELSVNVADCNKCTEEDRAVIGLEVYESKESHYLFVATYCSVYRLAVAYPEHVKDSINAIKR